MGKRERVTGSDFDFDDVTIVEVWVNAVPTGHFELYKKDHHNHLMLFDDYSNQTEYGWRIEYLVPPSKGGTDDPKNLRAVNWKNGNV